MARKKYRIPDQKSVTYGVSAEEIARICEISFRTACRWKSGTATMPATARMVLAADLGCLDPHWSGWLIRQGLLVSPEGWEIKMSDVLSVPILRQRLAAYVTELHRLQNADERAKDLEQPLPEVWPEWVFEKLA